MPLLHCQLLRSRIPAHLEFKQALPNSRIVFNDEHLTSLFHAHFSFAMRGSARKNVVPVRSSLFTHARPRCASATRLTTESPMPVPDALRSEPGLR